MMKMQVENNNNKSNGININNINISNNNSDSLLPQQQQQQQQIQLPYEPIKFVYTQTIGSLEDKLREIIDPYIWSYEDLLQPKIVFGKSKIEYYLFHIAPIYNWLRHVQSPMLAQYINKVDDNNNNKSKINNNHNLNNSNKSSSIIVYAPFSYDVWKYEMKHYIQQWQIAKLCATAKIKILTTRTQQQQQGQKNTKNNDKNFNNNPNKKHQQQQNHNQQQQLICTHLIKKDKFINQYVLTSNNNNQHTTNSTNSNYNNNTNQTMYKLQCNKIYCQQCQKQITIKSQITKYPFAPYFNKYYGKEFKIITNNQSQLTKLTYQLIIVYCKQKCYVKSSAGVWYQINYKENKKSIVSFQKIDTKNGLIYVYQQFVGVKGNKVLRKAQPLKVEENKKEQKGLVDLQKFITKQKKYGDDSDQDEVENHKKSILLKQNQKVIATVNVNNNKPQQPTSTQQITKTIIAPLLASTQQQPQQQQQQDDNNEPLEDMSKNPLPIVLNKKKTQRKLFKQYKKTVQSLLPKPKEKDQYERQYDKGKTKKIHKNKQQFRTANFFDLYNKLKTGEKHQDKQKSENNGGQQMRDENDNDNGRGFDRKRDNNKAGNVNENDDDYNIVYQPKRNDRFGDRRGGGFRGGRGDSRGRGRGGRGGGFRNRDRNKGGNQQQRRKANNKKISVY